MCGTRKRLARKRFLAVSKRKAARVKTITFAIPCYNSANYMDKCIQSILDCGGEAGLDDIEIIIVDDGSTKDNTLEIAQGWEARYPGVIRAIHQENGGHGAAVNTGLAAAKGLYYKVVDSDDWLDADSMAEVMKYLRAQAKRQRATDLVVANYVYEKVHEGTRTIMGYTNVFPTDKEFSWQDCGHFRPSQYLLMHSVIYRTQLLRETGLKLPEHCFYVDNIFVYVPLPFVDTIRYLDVDMYRYFIGREDQSVNESVMMGRIDQQLRITRFMIDAVKLPNDVIQPKLRTYMKNYLSMMMCICSIFCRMIGTDKADQDRKDIWAYLKKHNPGAYSSVRSNVLNLGTNLPGKLGRDIGITGYHVAQKIFKFN